MSAMDMHDTPPAFALPNGHPSSPPMTPGTSSIPTFPPQTDRTSPIYKPMNAADPAQSPPLDSVEGQKFHFSRPHSTEPLSRPSTASGRAPTASPHASEYETDSDSDSDESTQESAPPPRLVEKADFVLEELDSEDDDPDFDSDIEVLRPDNFEDAKSDVSGSRVAESEFIGQFNDLNCDVSTDEDEEINSAQYQRYMMRRRKRWSLGVHKRTYSQSIEGDSSYSDDDPLDDNDSTARRLRRRVRGPGNRASLHFEDMGFPNMNNIIEIDEPDYAGVMHSQGPPSIPSDDGFTLDELPFWGWQGTAQLMEWEVESDSS